MKSKAWIAGEKFGSELFAVLNEDQKKVVARIIRKHIEESRNIDDNS